MLDLKILRHSVEVVAAQLKKRGFHFDVTLFNALEEQRKTLQVELQRLQNERNVRSKEVGIAKSTGNNVDDALQRLKLLSDELKGKENEFAHIQAELDAFLATVPNVLHESVPDGATESDNQVIRVWGEPPAFSFAPKDHVSLGEKNGWIDFETASKLAGARFVVLRGPFARLQRALIQFMMDLHINEHGYQEITVPYLVNANCLYGTGQFPKLKEDVFSVNDDKYFLIPTSESPVTNTVADSIIEEDQLPIKYTCYSSCFRSEAGSYGKDLRGMLRQHQFEKVELVHIVHPDQSYIALEELTRHAEVILQRLEIPYRVVALCSGDVGFSAAKTYDIEVWLPGQNCYREISSCSNTEAFQARRMKARFRDAKGNIEWVHTLNGSGLAVGRALIALIENYQDELGRIRIPAALQPYMNGMEMIE